MRNVPGSGANGGRRSSAWFERNDLDGFLRRSWLKSIGIGAEAFRGRPVIGVCNSWSELVSCNVHLRGLAESVKRGANGVSTSCGSPTPA
jgi:dihydroxy-acid dehydratase